MSDLNFTSSEDLKRIVRGNTDKRITYILGAGASAGYSPGTKIKPPVVRDLFNRESNDLVHQVLNESRHKSVYTNREFFMKEVAESFDGDLEAFLSSLYKKNSDSKVFSNVLLYLQELFSEIGNHYVSNNNYSKLIQVTEANLGKNWSVISFNYDTLFEQAYKEVDMHPGKDFLSLPNYELEPKLLKIHGSTNFYHIHDIDTPHYQEMAVFSDDYLFKKMMSDGVSGSFPVLVSDIKPPSPIRAQRLNEKRDQRINTARYMSPLMLIPMHAESVPSNSFFSKMVRKAVEEISNADYVVAIGYNFGDDTFTSALKKEEHSSKLILVGLESSRENLMSSKGYEKVTEIWGKENVSVLEADGFDGLIKAIY